MPLPTNISWTSGNRAYWHSTSGNEYPRSVANTSLFYAEDLPVGTDLNQEWEIYFESLRRGYRRPPPVDDPIHQRLREHIRVALTREDYERLFPVRGSEEIAVDEQLERDLASALLRFLGRNRYGGVQSDSEKQTDPKEDEDEDKDQNPKVSNKRLRATEIDLTGPDSDSVPDTKRPRIEVTAVASIPRDTSITTYPAIRAHLGLRIPPTAPGLRRPYDPTTQRTRVAPTAHNRRNTHGNGNVSITQRSLLESPRIPNQTGRAIYNTPIRPYEQARGTPAPAIRLHRYCHHCGYDLRGHGHVCPSCGYQRIVDGRPIYDIDNVGQRIQGHVVMDRDQRLPQHAQTGYGVPFINGLDTGYEDPSGTVNGYYNPNDGTQDTFYVPRYYSPSQDPFTIFSQPLQFSNDFTTNPPRSQPSSYSPYPPTQSTIRPPTYTSYNAPQPSAIIPRNTYRTAPTVTPERSYILRSPISLAQGFRQRTSNTPNRAIADSLRYNSLDGLSRAGNPTMQRSIHSNTVRPTGLVNGMQPPNRDLQSHDGTEDQGSVVDDDGEVDDAAPYGRGPLRRDQR